MKTHIHRIDVNCDNCNKLSTDTSELLLSAGKKAWVSDLCHECMEEVLQYLTVLGMGGPQARKLPGSADAKTKGSDTSTWSKPHTDQEAKAKGQSYTGSKCRGCKWVFKSQQARRMHNSRSGCA